MYLARSGRPLALLLLLLSSPLKAQDVPPWLPRYDLDIRIDVAGHTVKRRQQITWTNRHHPPTRQVVFNAHSHYKVPRGDIGFFAKTLELLRMSPKEALDTEGEVLQVDRGYLLQDGRLINLPFRFEGDTDTALTVTMPHDILPGETVCFFLEHTVRLPQKMGRWGQ